MPDGTSASTKRLPTGSGSIRKPPRNGEADAARAACARGEARRVARLLGDPQVVEVDAIEIAEQERNLPAADARADLQEGQAVAAADHLQVEGAVVEPERAQAVPREREQRVVGRAGVEHHRAERLAVGEIEAGVDVARGTRDHEFAVGDQPVDVIDRPFDVLLALVVGTRQRRPQRRELRRRIDTPHARAGRAGARLQDQRKTQRGERRRIGRVDLVQRDEARHAQARRGHHLLHHGLVAKAGHRRGPIAGDVEGLAQPARRDQVEFRQRDQPVDAAQRRAAGSHGLVQGRLVEEVGQPLEMRDTRGGERGGAVGRADVGHLVRGVVDVAVIGGEIVGPAIEHDDAAAPGRGLRIQAHWRVSFRGRSARGRIRARAAPRPRADRASPDPAR
ncbi:hypothetical protein [Burkholderia gladioli]|uniref:hypothetical protein n=1 Tax=Burkholderia gladioli TaxID=28095 RepID=UPI0030834890